MILIDRSRYNFIKEKYLAMESHDQHHTPIYILEDWEEDIWKRVYFVVKRNANFYYTEDKAEA